MLTTAQACCCWMPSTSALQVRLRTSQSSGQQSACSYKYHLRQAPVCSPRCLSLAYSSCVPAAGGDQLTQLLEGMCAKCAHQLPARQW
jgi:hypothetical protein